MDIEMNEMTEFVQRELDDPLYKCVYDTDQKTWDVLRFRKHQSGEGGYYALQKSYSHPIDQRVINDFKENDLRNVELKLYFHEQEQQEERIRKKSAEEAGLATAEFFKRINTLILHPREIFIMNRLLKKQR
jgi:hypothetical protein